MSSFKTECRKFQPNIFNKTKCSNCFRQKEEHSAEALECNRASRKVSKCGYLFVAPDWDFSIPLNRTKRWQRRWFVLFDDGELTYSVDDLPATIPQGVIDMNRVLEVTEAEDVTGNQFALAITSPDRATFVKGTCREESRWWHDVLSVFTRAQMQHGRHKRNATFPGIKSCSVLQQTRAYSRTSSAGLASLSDRATSYHHAHPLRTRVGRPSSAPTFGGEINNGDNNNNNSNNGGELQKDMKPIPSSPTPIIHSTSAPSSARLMREEHKENTPPYIQDYEDNPPTSESPPTQDKGVTYRPRTRRTAKREARGLVDPRRDLDSKKKENEREGKLKDIAESITRTSHSSLRSYSSAKNGLRPTRESEHEEPNEKLNGHNSLNDFIRGITRGDPDGCGVVESVSGSFSSSFDVQRVDLPAEDLLYIKKGWLMKQSLTKGTSLRFFRDPSAEDNAILDGIIDLGMVKDIEEKEVGRNYGFIVSTWDEKRYVLSALTCGIRSNWVQALRNAANLMDNSHPPVRLPEKVDMDIVASVDSSFPAFESYCDVMSVMSPTYRERSSVMSPTYHDILSLSNSSKSEYWTSCDSFSLGGLKDRTQSKGGSLHPAKRSQSTPISARKATRDNFLASSKKDEESLLSDLPPSAPSCRLSDSVSSCISEADSLQLLQEAQQRQTPEKDLKTGDSLLVDLLETQVESLKAKLEQTQDNYMDLHKQNMQLRDRLSGLEPPASVLVEPQKRRLQSDSLYQNTCTFGFISSNQRDGEPHLELKELSNIKTKLESVNKEHQKEKQDLQERLTAEEVKVKHLKKSQTQNAELIQHLTRSLHEAELKVVTSPSLAGVLKDDKKLEENFKLREKMANEEITRLKNSLKSEKSEVYKWKDLVKELRSLLDGRNEELNNKKAEVNSLQEKLNEARLELREMAARLSISSSGSENYDQGPSGEKIRRGSSSLSLCSSRFSASKKNLPRISSLSDLTNFDMNISPEDLEKENLNEEYCQLRIRFEKAIHEIMALKRELRDGQNTQDDLELTNQHLRNEIKAREDESNSQIALMTSRIQDLTNKFSNSEKQVRTLKQKMGKVEGRERRRTQSLKGRESLALSKDMEVKLSQLESKVDRFLSKSEVEETGEGRSKMAKRSKSFEESTKASRMRRKSLDGQSCGDALKAIVRINQLESKVALLCGEELKKTPWLNQAMGTSSNNSSTSNIASSQSHLGASTNSLQHAPLPKSPTPQMPSPMRSPLRSPSTPRKGFKPSKISDPKLIKLNRSESEPRILQEKLNVLEKVLNTLQAKLTESVNYTEALECTCTCQAAPLSHLQQTLTSALHLMQSRTSHRDQDSVKRIQPLTLRLQELLKEKMAQLADRRQRLKLVGKWTRDSQLKCFAERLAFESLIFSQIAQSLQVTQNVESYEASLKLQELTEAHRMLSFLEKKLANPELDMDPMTPLEFHTNLLAEKLVVESHLINNLSVVRPHKSRTNPIISETCKNLQKRLLDRERNLANLVTKYKEEKLQEIAVVMARETVTGTQPPHDDTVLLEELRLREVWSIAQDLIAHELVNLETCQSVIRLSHLLGRPSTKDYQPTLEMSTSSLEKLHIGAEESLRQEMEESIFTLSNKYEDVLAQHRAGNVAIVNSVSASMNTVLNEFAAVVAQKAIIDGHLAVAVGDENQVLTSEPLKIVEEKIDIVESATDVVTSEEHLLMFLGGGNSTTEAMVHSSLTQAEFSFVYNKMIGQTLSEIGTIMSSFAVDQSSSITRRCGKSLNSSASELDPDTPLNNSKIPPSPKSHQRLEPSRKSRRVSDITGMVQNCRHCEDLRHEISRLRRLTDGKRTRKKDKEDCKKCAEYCQTVKQLEDDHKISIEALESQHQSEIDRLRDQVKYDPPTRDSDDELTELKRRLCLLEEGYEAQIATLKKQYQEALGNQADVREEQIRQKYQLEMDHLREICEKGLKAMESSHRRLILELEEKHEREMSALQMDKEEALAEETQATLAALDAMRKAHEAEVQKEVTKFKEEFLRKMEHSREEGSVSRLHEDELREVRMEILSLSEKYSSKCLEIAAKDQRLEGLQRQLNETKEHVRSLEERNRQLHQRLTAQITAMKSESGNEFLGLHECELALKDEEIWRLKEMLQKSKMHENDLNKLCGQLNEYIRAERTQTQTLTLTEGHPKDKKTHSRGREVFRSPSFPGLSQLRTYNFSGENDETLLRSTSPLHGMVALRKRIFEDSLRSKTES